MSSIFISYNRESEAPVKVLVDDIETLGHAVWLDQELKGGQVWWDQILATIRNCDVFIFVLHPRTLNSSACKLEYGYASALGKPILPVLVAEGVSTNLLPPALSQIQFVDYRKQDRDAALRLARAIAVVPPAKPLPDPLPTPPEVPISYLGRLADQIDTAPALSYEQQSALVFDLKQGLRDPEAADDACALLGKLRKRRDLLATIAEDIDELLASIRKTPERRGDLGQEDEIVVPEGQQESEKTSSTTPGIEQPSVPRTPTLASDTVSRRERTVTALVGGLLGIVFGLAILGLSGARIDDLFLAVIPTGGGAIAGAIAGTQKRRWLGVCLGIASGWIIGSIVFADGPHPIGVGGILGAPPGAILGAIATQVRSRRSRKQRAAGSAITNPQESH